MAKKTGNYEIPFDSDGNQLHYPETYWGKTFHFRPNFEFQDTLTFTTYSRGRSAAYFYFKRTDGTTVTVFMSDFCAMVPHLIDGRITGKFTFTKKGANYGCMLVEAASATPPAPQALGPNGLPRRIQLPLQTPAETAIRAAVQAVEEMPADVRLTEAVILLTKAQEKVADFVDATLPIDLAP